MIVSSGEGERLALLASYGVVGGERSRFFDDLATLAAGVVGAPMALFSVVGAEQVWCQATVGIESMARERATSICTHVVESRAPLIVPDTHADPRFASQPYVTGGPRVRFYVGVPLLMPGGAALGVLAAIDVVPRTVSPQQLELLRTLARQAMDQLEARRERHIAIANAERSAARKQAMLDAATDGYILHDQAGVTATNLAARTLLGIDDAPVLRPRHTLLRPDGSTLGDGEDELLTHGPARVVGVVAADGHRRWVQVTTHEATPGSYVTCLRDVTKERDEEKNRERLAHNQRLLTTGTLAAGVGHEINNPLAYVLANLELSLEEVRGITGGKPQGRFKQLAEALADAKEGAELIRRIVRGLRALAREESQPVPCDLKEAAETALHMAMHELRPKAKVEFELDGVAPVLADEARLSQLFVNLLVNAGQAFEQAQPERNWVRISAHENVDAVVIRVEDNGPGIAPDHLARIFDPFFSTKPVGVGTGLGLAICHGIVIGLGGSITCTSTLGQGACFEIVLPRALVHEQQSLFDATPPGPVGRVLVVDDDAGVLRSMQRTLASKHHVATYVDAREALSHLEAGARYDVVFCDVMMPHMRGTELYRRVWRIDPNQASRFVFITGGTADDSVEQIASQAGVVTLEKPFTTEDLRMAAERYIKLG